MADIDFDRKHQVLRELAVKPFPANDHRPVPFGGRIKAGETVQPLKRVAGTSVVLRYDEREYSAPVKDFLAATEPLPDD